MDALRAEIVARGFALVAGAKMRPLIAWSGGLADWERFAASWSDLELDIHLPDGHRYRRRRHATLSAPAGETRPTVEKHQPHYQGLEYNRLVGGVERWFEPIRPEILAGATLNDILSFCLRLYGPLRPAANWHIECHQFRIEARRDAAGLPTPEGVHRDGVDYVLVLLVDRTNIASGTTTVHALDGTTLGDFTLARPFDSALVDDSRVMHGVTAVQPLDPTQPAYRDVLVVTLKAR
ncbi:MAG: 2OG-Fe dioxygenase family protein [Usitatibacter sp.]